MFLWWKKVIQFYQNFSLNREHVYNDVMDLEAKKTVKFEELKF